MDETHEAEGQGQHTDWPDNLIKGYQSRQLKWDESKLEVKNVGIRHSLVENQDEHLRLYELPYHFFGISDASQR